MSHNRMNEITLSYFCDFIFKIIYAKLYVVSENNNITI